MFPDKHSIIFMVNELFTLTFIIKLLPVKETVPPNFVEPFLACMDRSRQEKKPLQVFKFF